MKLVIQRTIFREQFQILSNTICDSNKVKSGSIEILISYLIIYLDLRFRHVESIGKFRSFGTRQIFRLFERFFQGEDLLAAKGWPRVFLL